MCIRDRIDVAAALASMQIGLDAMEIPELLLLEMCIRDRLIHICKIRPELSTQTQIRI